MDPSPCNEEKRAADEMKLDGTVERQPMEPSPCKELVNCGVEIMLDKDKEDKKPIEPKPTKELVSCGVETRFDGNVTDCIFKLLNSEPSPTKRLLLIVVP